MAGEARQLVEIAVVQRLEDLVQHLQRQPDIDDDAVGAERLAEKGDVDHEGRAVQPLRRAEDLARQAVGNHDVVANLDGVHGGPHGAG